MDNKPVSIFGFTVQTDRGPLSFNFGSASGPQSGSSAGDPPPDRKNVSEGLSAAFVTDNLSFLLSQEGYPDNRAVDAFIDHMVDIVGFRLPSSHRVDLIPTEGSWMYWDPATGKGENDAPTPGEIADALDAAYIAVGSDEPSNAACIAFLFGFDQ